LREFLGNAADATGNIQKRLVLRTPPRDRTAILWERLQPAKRRTVPIHGAHDDGNDPRLARLVSRHGMAYFHIIAIIRS